MHSRSKDRQRIYFCWWLTNALQWPWLLYLSATKCGPTRAPTPKTSRESPTGIHRISPSARLPPNGTAAIDSFSCKYLYMYVIIIYIYIYIHYVQCMYITHKT